jgi:hypothetical protein
MEKRKVEPETAFIVDRENISVHNVVMSKRFYAACAAMQGILANEQLRITILADERNGHPNLIGIAYEYADEFLNKENQ